MELYKLKSFGSIYCVVNGVESLVIIHVDDSGYCTFCFSIMDISNLGGSFERFVPEGSLYDFVNDPLFELEVLRKWNQ